MTTRVMELWDRPRARHALVGLALAVLFAGALAFYVQQNRYVEPHPNTQPNPSPFFRDGARIPVPKAAIRTMNHFISDAVLRNDLAAAWKESTGVAHGGVTRAAWMSGSIPVAPFERGTIFTRVKTIESREKRVWFELLVTPKVVTPGAGGGEYFCMLAPHGHGWIVTYWGPKQWNPPVPASGGR
jgi:hypothetical protein